MERTITIPEMSKENIVAWYKTIKPIVESNGKDVYLRELADDELIGKAYTWLGEESDYGEEVDFSNLSFLADVKMLHKWGYYGFFKPSVGEVIRQIPKEMLEKVVAFKIIYSPDTCDDFSLFRKEFYAHYHVSIVRLYQRKNGENETTNFAINSLNNDFGLPIGMTMEEFEKVKGRIKV